MEPVMNESLFKRKGGFDRSRWASVDIPNKLPKTTASTPYEWSNNDVF